MPGIELTGNDWLLAIFIIFSGATLLQLIFYWLIFFPITATSPPVQGSQATNLPESAHPESAHLDSKLPESFPMASSSPDISLSPLPPVSVIICAHNEYYNLERNLPQILDQDYPEFEVVVVNHASTDDSGSLLKELSGRYARLKVVTLERDLNFFSGKKFPLSLGIRSARHDIILLTDADCTPSGAHWIREMASGLNPSPKKGGKTRKSPAVDDIKIVLGYSPYKKHRGLVNALIRFDAFQTGMQYLSFAKAGMPYMGVGRNLLYRRGLFFQNKGFIEHYKIKSGDDDLFINRVANRKNSSVVLSPGSFVWSEPKKTLASWLHQKRRHYTTGGHYRFAHQLILGIYTLLQLLFWIPLVILLSFKFAWVIILTVLLLKLGNQMVVFGLVMKRLQTKDLIPWIPLLELGMILINLGIMGANMIRKPVKWK